MPAPTEALAHEKLMVLLLRAELRLETARLGLQLLIDSIEPQRLLARPVKLLFAVEGEEAVLARPTKLPPAPKRDMQWREQSKRWRRGGRRGRRVGASLLAKRAAPFNPLYCAVVLLGPAVGGATNAQQSTLP